jgi:hypothetical protein
LAVLKGTYARLVIYTGIRTPPSDLHALFDRWLITIDPDTWSIQVAPELKRYPGIAALDGQPVLLPEALRPQRKYIEDHASTARAAWT